MLQYNIQEAKTHLSLLVNNATNGCPFIIAKAGRPMVKVVPVSFEEMPKRRIGFMKGKIAVPADFDSLGSEKIEKLFSGAQ